MKARADSREVLALRVPAASTQLAGLRHRMRDWLAARDIPTCLCQSVVMATDEALANAIEHGYRYDGESGVVDLTVRVEPDTVAVQVVDHGSWKIPVRAAGSTRGWGLKIIESLAGRVRLVHARDSTALTAHFPRHECGPHAGP
jgi:anti-sigma regulatory factor (Ser/Thr protein kinase)